jgi:GPI mannosyltransferase 3
LFPRFLHQKMIDALNKLKPFYIVCIIFHFLTAWYSIGRYQSDEQYQIIEFAAYKKGINKASDLPWEFKENMRPAIQVFIAYSIINSCELFGLDNPFTQAFFLRLFSAILGIISSLIILRYFKYLNSKLFNILKFLLFFWSFIPWLHVRYSSENISASVFIIGFFSLIKLLNQSIQCKYSYSKYFSFFVIIGLSSVIRLQSSFFIIGLLTWLIVIKKINLKLIILSILGLFSSFLIGLAADFWFYNKLTCTAWNYFEQNIILHKAENFGSSSIWLYFEEVLLGTIPPFSLLIIFSFFYFFIKQPKSVYTFLISSFLIFHFISPHKELRFLFPLISFVPIIFILSVDDLIHKSRLYKLQKIAAKNYEFTKKSFLFINTILLLYLSFSPADNYTPVLKFIYSQAKMTTGDLFVICEEESINPYNNMVSLSFYRAKNVKITIGNSNINQLKKENPNANFLYMSYKKGIKNLNNEHNVTKIYSSINEWLTNFNFNNWVERLNPIYIYNIKKQ